MKRAISYIRVSTNGQADGLGLQHQEARIREFAKLLGYEVKKVYRDVHTGRGANSIRDRKGLQDAIKYAKANRYPIIVSTYDRLGRHAESVNDLLDNSGVNIFSTEVGEEAIDAVIRVLAGDAERTGNAIASATKKALKLRKMNGIRLGNPTNLSEAQKLGAESNKRRSDLMAEEYALIIDKIITDGPKSKKQIAEALNKRGMRTSRGLEWSEGNVRRLLEVVNRKLAETRQIREHEEYTLRAKNDPLFGKFA